MIPYLRLYGEHFFARTTQGILEGGWRTQPFGGVVFGAQLAYEEGRVTDDSAFLQEHNFEDLDPSASLGLHAEGNWKVGPVPLNALLRYRHDWRRLSLLASTLNPRRVSLACEMAMFSQCQNEFPQGFV